MTDKRKKELANGEEIVATLSINKKAIKFDLLTGVSAVLFGLIIFVALLVIYFAHKDANSSNYYLIMGCCAGVMFLIGAVMSVLELLQYKYAGLILTNKRIVGIGGFPKLKKIDILHSDNKGFQVFKAKRGAYFVRINDNTLAYMENPEEFEATFYELVEKNIRNTQAQS